MAWMSDEAWDMISDSRDKKSVARSARSTRTHCGKRGAVKFPSDYLSKKELKNMSGECKSYRMNEPMTWKEFKEMPDDLKVCYIKALKQKYNVPDTELADMFGCCKSSVSSLLKSLGLSGGPRKNRFTTWDREGFLAWRGGAKDSTVEHVEVETEETEEIEESFENTVDTEAEDIPTLEEMSGEDLVEYIQGSLQKYDEPSECKTVTTNVDEDAEFEPAKTLTEDQAKFDTELLERYLSRGQAKTPVKIDNDTQCCGETKCVVPYKGEMAFEGHVDDILRTIRNLLNGHDVKLKVEWQVRGEEKLGG